MNNYDITSSRWTSQLCYHEIAQFITSLIQLFTYRESVRSRSLPGTEMQRLSWPCCHTRRSWLILNQHILQNSSTIKILCTLMGKKRNSRHPVQTKEEVLVLTCIWQILFLLPTILQWTNTFSGILKWYDNVQKHYLQASATQTSWVSVFTDALDGKISLTFQCQKITPVCKFKS